MNHDQAAPMLPEYLQGGLDPTQRDAVAAHLRDCAECAALARTHDLLSEALAESEGVAPTHPASEALVAYALAADRMPTEDLARIAGHLAECDRCEQAVAATRQAEARLGRARAGGWLGFLRSRTGLAVAAGGMLLVVGGTAFLSGYWLPRSTAELDTLRFENRRLDAELAALREAAAHPAEEWGGRIELAVFEPPLRGAEPRPRLEIQPGQASVPVVVVPPSLGDLAASDSLRLEIRREDGEPAWDTAMTVGEARRGVQRSRLLAFCVPASRLRPGAYRLELRPGPDAEPLLRIPFDVALAG
jgi:hypothetical protein